MSEEFWFKCAEETCPDKCEMKTKGASLPMPIFCPIWGGRCLWEITKGEQKEE
jgi:hypothetical protein